MELSSHAFNIGGQTLPVHVLQHPHNSTMYDYVHLSQSAINKTNDVSGTYRNTSRNSRVTKR